MDPPLIPAAPKTADFGSPAGQQSHFVAVQITWRAPPPLPLARTTISSTLNPDRRNRSAKCLFGPDDQTANTPPLVNAIRAAFRPAIL